tara:strand:+ start:1781 stop:2704 length:924 start_codon:yes stop_codon:yes gene_type:complete
MSEEENPSTLGGGLESAPQETPQAAPTQGIDFASPDVYKQFVSSLPENLQSVQSIQNTENFQALADQMVNAQSALGKKRLEAPQEDWTQEQWDGYYDQIRPEGGEYEIPESINLPEGYNAENIPQFEDDTLQEIVDLAGTMGLSQQQFNQLYGAYNTMIMDAENLNTQEQQDTLKEYNMSLRGEWGGLYDQNLQASNQAYEAIANDIPEIRELVEANPYVANHPGVLKLFNKIAEISGDSLPLATNTDPTSGFGKENVHSIRAQLQDLDTNNKELLLSNPSALPLDQRAERDALLAKRQDLFNKLYS